MPQCFDLFYRVNNSSGEAELAAAETKETYCTVNASPMQTIQDLQTLSGHSLPNIFPHNTPPANKIDSLKFEKE